jgi:eukaryotic-like serine/threonine-protein kinase
MSSARHDRVKQVFLGALEHSGDDRTEYLRKECGADRELRRDVDALLAAHRDSTVLVGGIRHPDQFQTSGSIERFARLFDLLAFLFGTRTRRMVAVLVTVAVAVMIGYWTRTQAQDMLLTQAGSALRAVLNSNATALVEGLEEWKSEAGAVVETPAVTRALNELLTTRSSDAWNRLVSLINPRLSGERYHSYLIISAAGELVATSAGLAEGRATPAGMAALGRMSLGSATVEFPGPGSDFGETADQRSVWPRTVVLAPIRQPDGRMAGAFALVLAMDDVDERFRQGRPFETGETYLFREDGLLLSPSRFTADLERWKLANPSGDREMPMGVYLRDPGRNLYDSNGLRPHEDPTSWPLTELVRVAVASGKAANGASSGVILTPYRDYRGVQVVGAWRWSPELGAGLTAEVDEVEILSTLRFIDWPVGLFILLAGGAGAWVILSSFLLTRLRGRTPAGEAYGQYTLIEKLGEGGVGEVFLAHHTHLRRPAVVKLLRRDRLSPVFLQQFEREAQAASRLRHPNTVQIYDFGQTQDGAPYYAMEHVPGLDLGQWVKRYGPMVPGRAIYIVKQICAALSEAHRQDIIHRDIKPANVMLCELAGQQDFVKVLDFGLAKDNTEPTEETSPLVRSGTPFYTPPERLLPNAQVDQRCDIYAVGVLLYFLICGVTPYEPGADWIESTLSGDTVPPSQRLDLPRSVERTILDCICREPAGRPGSAQELLDRLCRLDDVPQWNPEKSRADGAAATR